MGDAITVHGDTSQGGIFTFGAPEWRAADERGPFRTCSYCGSIHPEDLVALGEAGRINRIDRADMKYGWPHKVYVDVTNPEPGRLHGKFYNVHQAEQDVTDELRTKVARLTGHWVEPTADGRIAWGAFNYAAGAA